MIEKHISDKLSAHKKRQSIRSKERFNNHQIKLLDNFVSGINTGYFHENWDGLSELYRRISAFVTLEEYNALGQLWRESFAGNLSPSYVEKIVEMVKVRVISGQNA